MFVFCFYLFHFWYLIIEFKVLMVSLVSTINTFSSKHVKKGVIRADSDQENKSVCKRKRINIDDNNINDVINDYYDTPFHGPKDVRAYLILSSSYINQITNALNLFILSYRTSPSNLWVIRADGANETKNSRLESATLTLTETWKLIKTALLSKVEHILAVLDDFERERPGTQFVHW